MTTSSALLAAAEQGTDCIIIRVEPDLALEHDEVLDSKSNRPCLLVSASTEQRRDEHAGTVPKRADGGSLLHDLACFSRCGPPAPATRKT